MAVRSVIAAVLTASVLGACSASGGGAVSGTRTPAPDTSAAPTATATATGTATGTADPGRSGLDYVALGDSYSAGPLIPVQRLDPLGCGRSTNDYPAYLAGWLDVATYRDVTCSGATSRDVTGPQDVAFGGSVPPQVDALSADTDLVTVGIGGNDRGLFGRLVSTCLSTGASAHPGVPDPCRRAFAGPKGDRALEAARGLRRSVQAALVAVREAAPEAKVLAVGYPQLLPARGTCAAVPFAAGDYPWARRVERTLDASVRAAAGAAGATYVDLWTPSRGHDACAGRRAWVRGDQDVSGAAVFHPFRSGERAMAGVVHRVLTGRPPPAGTGPASPPAGSVVTGP